MLRYAIQKISSLSIFMFLSQNLQKNLYFSEGLCLGKFFAKK